MYKFIYIVLYEMRLITSETTAIEVKKCLNVFQANFLFKIFTITSHTFPIWSSSFSLTQEKSVSDMLLSLSVTVS